MKKIIAVMVAVLLMQGCASINLSKRTECEKCKGTGYEIAVPIARGMEICSFCHDTGIAPNGAKCPRCSTFKKRCGICNGTGYIREVTSNE